MATGTIKAVTSRADVDGISKSTLRDVPFAVAVSDWALSSGVYTAQFLTDYITSSSKEICEFDYTTVRAGAKADIGVTKKSGGGGLTFTTTVIPTGTITGTAYVFDNDDKKLPVLVENTVIGIANGGTGQSSLAGAQEVLGITALNSKITTIYDTSSTLTGLQNGVNSIKINSGTTIGSYTAPNNMRGFAVKDGSTIVGFLTSYNGEYMINVGNNNLNHWEYAKEYALNSKITFVDQSVSVQITGVGFGYQVINHANIPSGYTVKQTCIAEATGANTYMFATNTRSSSTVLWWYSSSSGTATLSVTLRHLCMKS